MNSMLDNLVFSHPFPALIAFFLVIGLFYLGTLFAFKYFNGIPSLIESVSGYLAVVIFIGFLADLALHGIINLYILNLIAFILVLMGVLQLWRFFLKINVVFKNIKSISFINKFQIIIVLIILGSLLLASLGPPTDADSLDYHLGVPAGWLLQGYYLPFESWYHARFAGLGERIIFFGLANGTDVLSAVLQWSGLLVSIVALFNISSKRNMNDLILSSLLVISPPVIIFLVLNQKPYLFPVSIIMIGVALLFDNNNHYERKMYLSTFLIFSALLFKYTFFLSMISLSMLMLFLVSRNKLLIRFLIIGFLLAAIVLLPHFTRNFIYFSNPFSPLFSSLVPNSDVSLINFANYLKLGYQPTFENIVKIPFTEGIFPSRLGLITLVIGVGGLGILVAYFSKTLTSRALMATFTLSFIIIIILGRPISRLMFDVYLLGGMALIASDFYRFKIILSKILSIQSLGVLILSIYAMYNIFPGSFSDNKRAEVMSAMADGYSVSRLLDEILPKEAVLLTDIRSKVLIPRTVVLADNINYIQNQSAIEEMIIAEDEKYKITHIALKLPTSNKYNSLLNCAVVGGTKNYDVEKATRNPLNKAKYQITVFMIDRNNVCFLK